MNQPNITTCPDNDTLIAILNGSVETSEVIDQHLRDCESCRDRLDGLSEDNALQQIRSTVDRSARSFSFLDDPRHGNDLGSIDHIRIEREIGRGGLGIVFAGFDESLKRNVAVKVLNNDASQRSDERFDRESAAAAKVSGDHVVAVHSVGRTIDGRPYLVMPLLTGGSLRKRLTGEPMSAVESAEVIRQIAMGLVAIHGVKLIHRDVKPANILFDDTDDRAKLTDFGLARELGDGTLTQANVLCGTPEYMSPEQSAGQRDLDRKTDIYSLGITLYECLTGIPPFRGQPLQILQQHQDVEPIAPSQLNQSVPRDLENICLKAIAKLPHHRYSNALAFAYDLERFLDGRPVIAKPVSQLTKLWMWSKRNRALATAVSLFVVALLAGTIVSTVMWFRSEHNAMLATKANQQSQQRLTQLEAGNQVLFDIFKDIDLGEVKGGGQSLEVTLGERLLTAAGKIDEGSIGDPLTEARMKSQLGISLTNLGYHKEAIPLIQSAIETQNQAAGSQQENTADAQHNLGLALFNDGQYQAALESYQLAHQSRTAIHGESHPDTLRSLHMVAFTLIRIGQLEQGIETAEKVFELRKSELGEDHFDTLNSMSMLGENYWTMGRRDQGFEMMSKVYESRRKSLGEENYFTMLSNRLVTIYLIQRQQYEEALPRYESIYDWSVKNLGIDHIETMTSRLGLAFAYQNVGRLDEAIRHLEELLDMAREKLGPDHPGLVLAMNNLASAYQRANKLEDAIKLFEETLTFSRKHYGDEHPNTLMYINNLAVAYSANDQNDKAKQMYEEAIRLNEKTHGRDHPQTMLVVANLGMELKESGHYEEAIVLLEEAANASRKYNELWWSIGELIDACRLADQSERAKQIYSDFSDMVGALDATSNLLQIDNFTSVAIPVLKLGMFEEAEELWQKIWEASKEVQPDSWLTFRALTFLGSSKLGLERYDEAKEDIENGYAGMLQRINNIPANIRYARMRDVINERIKLAEKTNNAEALEKWTAEKKKYVEEEN